MFSERLNLLRKSRGITAQYMATQLNMQIRGYRKYESGDTQPSLDTLIHIADILNVSIDWLLGRDEWLESHGVSVDVRL